MSNLKKICIIGGGSSGLTSIKACLEEGLKPICFEKTDKIGGLWRYRDDDTDGLASVMKSTIINSSKEMSAYSDFPPPKEFPNYMHNSYMIRYIEMYAEEFDLVRHIHFRHEILKVEENHDFDETGRWKVTIRNIEEDRSFEDVFDGVMVCTGHHVFPHIPSFPGMEKFKGKILHTHSYKKPDGFSDKKVVVVGIGNSGGDVAVELSQIADKVYLSTRRGCWIIHRVGPNGSPFDAAFLRRYWNMIWQSIPFTLLCYFAERYINKRFNHETYNIKPDHRIFGQHPMVNDALPNRILSGTVIMKGNIKEFTQNGVIFEGEEKEHEVDVVILATGYNIKFPFVDENIFSFKNNEVDLYKYVVSPKLKHPSLAFIALAQTVGALLPVGEIQARWFALLMTKKVKLPSVEEMISDIQKKRDDIAKKYFESSRNTIQVEWIPYMDEISSIINAKPRLLHLLLTDPVLVWCCIFEPCLPYQYRLNGPHSWAGARNAIMTYEDRVIGALKTRNSSKTKEPGQYSGMWKFLNIILYLILTLFVIYMIFYLWYRPRHLRKMDMNKKICIIGGGSSGLTSIKACLEEGLKPICFEKTDKIGGLWRYRDDDTDGLASVMKSTIINSSKEMSAYSDFPPPKEFPNYMHNSYMIRYIEMYAEEFDLVRHIHFRHEILKVEENHDFDETGRWKVTIRNIEEDRSFEDVFDGVMVCTGHHVFPHIPSFPGMEKFKGKILHTHSYKKPDGFGDKKVVVVGIGNSGGDVAVELSQIADKVFLSTRSGSWIIQRVGPKGKPFDDRYLRRSWNVIWLHGPYKLMNYLTERHLNKKFDHAAYCLKPKHRIFEQHPMINDALPNRILSGTVIIKSDIKEFTENGVIFEGEKKEQEVDVVILATGYKIEFPFLDSKILSVQNNKVELYKFVIPPYLKHHSLGIIALTQPVGSLLPIGEIQARWFALLMANKIHLPPLDQMIDDIKKKMDMMSRRYLQNSRYTIQVDWIPYMDEIASLIKAKPNLMLLFFTNIKLFWKCFWGPCLPYQYRLEGPHSWQGARGAILFKKERLLGALKTTDKTGN
ncbi:uncharacterized protein LOC143223999 [Tachypleus tridentatus]|uniref:uncharacterized protein LOC143223999 n=1 Tax=Tachypleus tridentatus TaxID=6853 RepID=UPI003FD383AC